MRLFVVLALLATVYGSSPDECAWGESYWCSSIKAANSCGAFQHCMDTVWKYTKLEKEETDVCQFCEAIIKETRAFIDDKKNQDEIKTFLTNACNIIPDATLSELCKTSVTQEFDALIQMIDSELDPQTVCSAMGLCNGFKDKVQHKPAPHKEETDVCQFCEAIIKDIRDFVDDKNNQAVVKQMLNTVCKLIPDQEIATLCETAVEDEINVIIQMIDSKLDAEVCKQIQACTAAKIEEPVKEVEDDKEMLCDDCHKFFMEVKSKLSDESTIDEITDFVQDYLCALLGKYQQDCGLGVKLYMADILKLISSDVNPKFICSMFGFCESTPEAKAFMAKLILKKAPIHNAVQAGSAEECLLCKTVLAELQNLDRNKAVQKDVEDFLKKNLCGLLGTLQAVCEATVDQYGPELFELLVSELDPEARCSALGFCSAQTIEGVLRASIPRSPPPKSLPPMKQTSVAAPPSTQCVLCEFVIKTLDQELGDNATEAEIVQALDKVCESLPDTLKQTCEDFVNQYGPTVIALLLQELDPVQVCTKLGLCTSVAVSGNSECVLCEFVMNEIDQLLENNKTEAEIIAALDKVCQIMPSSVRANCLDFVNTYGPAVIALLEQELEPSVVCSVLGLCPSTKTIKHSKVADAEECGICETVIQYMDSLIEENATIEEIEQVLDKVCNFLPDTMKQQCTDLVKEYGPALIQMIAQYLDPREICTSIGLCSNSTVKEESNSIDMEKIVPVKVPLLGENECTQGPAFWCLNMKNALKCNTVDHCKRKVWN